MIAHAFARHLGDTVDGLTYDEDGATGNVFVGYMPSTPDVAVMVSVPAALPQPTRLPFDLPQPQFLIRGGRFDVRGVEAMAGAIYGELTCLDLVTIAAGTEDEVYVVGCSATSPIDIGVDANQRPERSINATAHIPNPTTHRPGVSP